MSIRKNNEMINLFKKYGHDKVIFVGFDVSKNFHYGGICNGYGEILVEPTKIDIYSSGMKKLCNLIDETVETTKAKVIVFGCEPSGHYYLNLMKKLKEIYVDGIFKLINPIATSSNRNQMMLRLKNDKVDCLAILDLLVRNECYDFRVDSINYRSIKEYVRYLDSLTKDKVRLKNKIHCYLDEIYPGLEEKLSKFTSTIYGLNFLQILPHPKKLVNSSPSDVEKLYIDNGFSVRPSICIKISEALKSIVIVNDPIIDTKINILRLMVNSYIIIINTIEQIKKSLEELLDKFSFTKHILDIKGMGYIFLARIIAYISDPNKFKDGGQVSSFAGLVSPQEQSGKIDKKGKSISKRGHIKLRSTLIQAAQLVINNCGYFTAFYNRLVLESGKHPNLAVTATANKLIKVIISMIHKGKPFNPPTAKNIELAKGRIPRIKVKDLEKIKKLKRSDPLTQSMLSAYLTRV